MCVCVRVSVWCALFYRQHIRLMCLFDPYAQDVSLGENLDV